MKPGWDRGRSLSFAADYKHELFDGRRYGLPNTGGATGKLGVSYLVKVDVRDNNVDQALRVLKKKLQREGVFREMKLRRAFEKPSARRKRESAEAVRRYRKFLRKRMEKQGY